MFNFPSVIMILGLHGMPVCEEIYNEGSGWRETRWRVHGFSLYYSFQFSLSLILFFKLVRGNRFMHFRSYSRCYEGTKLWEASADAEEPREVWGEGGIWQLTRRQTLLAFPSAILVDIKRRWRWNRGIQTCFGSAVNSLFMDWLWGQESEKNKIMVGAT